jgi:hypothetical protein
MKLLNCKYTSASGGCDLLGHPEMNILDCLWNCGFYSNQFQVFSSLLILMRHGIIPDKINYSMGYKHFKKDPDLDIYPYFHKINIDQPLDLFKEVQIPDANKYQPNLYDFESYNKIIRRFFNPSDVISERILFLKEKYQIDVTKTISVSYRGTDKGAELTLASPEKYLSVVQKILDKNPDFKVLIQTDQTQVIQYFYSVLGDRLIFFEETPSTTSNLVIWRIIEESGGDSVDWQQWCDAAFRVVSECKYVVNHTGNVAMFNNLYRGNIKNVYQFNEHGVLS